MGGYGDIKLLKEDGLRLDGRKIDEMRPIEIEAGILPGADGSAWVKHGLNIAVAARPLSPAGKMSKASPYTFGVTSSTIPIAVLPP